MGQYGELIQYLDEKFTAIDAKFSAIDQRFDCVESVLEQKADKEELRQMINTLDAVAKRTDAYYMELAAYKYRTNKMEKWVTKAAPKINLDYIP